ncbi:tyrosine-type recombinase/integrase [Methylobacterium sp. J-090]|uniref:tyrosine-type recombinase/integrase n=1 Tax=Methylobacterium sp. J-090 TaxID=2836666 RepID=UPI001FBA420F|nr:site-specific integrase [Methylobacterium sp. J-090]MCJ2080307.1 tyrosine-type recombinase/integrase [Methylobacterium sp. J-090]
MARRATPDNVLKLTKTVLASLAAEEGKDERVGWDSEVHGLGLRLRASGSRAWVIRPPRAGSGQSRLVTLGPGDTLDLGTARRVAIEKLAEVALGGDPTKARKEARTQAALTFASLLPTYFADKEKKGRRASTIGNMKNHLNDHWQPLHSRPLNGITRAEIAARHRNLSEECGPHAADRARSILSTFFVWAIREGLAEANPVANTNTATVPTRRERVLQDTELSAVWKACREDDFGRIVRLLILTGLRRKEVPGLRWSEIDLQAALWTIPADRMKNKRPHEMPLSSEVIAILSAAPARLGRDLVFGDGAAPFTGFSKAKASLDIRIGDEAGKWIIHDLRRTASTGMNTLGILPHVVEAVLSHVSGHKAGVAGTYNRASYRAEKREAVDRWADEVKRVVSIAPTQPNSSS